MPGHLRRLYALLPRSIVARGAIVLAMSVAAVAVPALMAYRTLAAASEQRRDRQVEILLTAMLADPAATAYAPASLADLCRQLPDRGRRVVWAGLLDHAGASVQVCGDPNFPANHVCNRVDWSEAGPSRRVLPGGPHGPPLEVLMFPQAGGTTAIAAVLVGDEPREGYHALALWLSAALAVVGISLAWVWFRVGVAAPVAAFGDRLAMVQSGLNLLANTQDVPAELVGLVRSMETLHHDLECWRGEVAYWRGSIDAAVDTRTREAARAQRRAEREADTDPLTRLGNRRQLERELPQMFEARRKAGDELAVILLDLDGLKRLNDTCGHQAGDAMIAFAGDLLRASARKGTDLAVRLGGDEFVLVLPGRTLSGVRETAQRLAALFAQRARTFNVQPPPSLSIGVAAMRAHRANSWEQLLKWADEAMYYAKRRRAGVAAINEVRGRGSPDRQA